MAGHRSVYSEAYAGPRIRGHPFRDDECRKVIVDYDGTVRTVVGHTIPCYQPEPFYKPEPYVIRNIQEQRAIRQIGRDDEYRFREPRAIRQIGRDDEYRFGEQRAIRQIGRDDEFCFGEQRAIRQISRDDEYLFRDDEYRHVVVDHDGGLRTVVGYTLS